MGTCEHAHSKHVDGVPHCIRDIRHAATSRGELKAFQDRPSTISLVNAISFKYFPDTRTSSTLLSRRVDRFILQFSDLSGSFSISASAVVARPIQCHVFNVWRSL